MTHQDSSSKNATAYAHAMRIAVEKIDEAERMLAKSSIRLADDIDVMIQGVRENVRTATAMVQDASATLQAWRLAEAMITRAWNITQKQGGELGLILELCLRRRCAEAWRDAAVGNEPEGMRLGRAIERALTDLGGL